MTVVYIDLLFLLNLTANYLLLLGAGRMSGAVLRRWRIALGAAAGALYAVLVFLPGLGWMSLWPCRLGAGMLMPVVAYGGERRLLRIILTFFGASAGLAGLVLGAELLGSSALTLRGGVLYSALDLRLLLLLFILCYCLLTLVFRRQSGNGGRRALIQLTVLLAGERVVLTALVDTGHTLTDPADNRPVVVAEADRFRRLLPSASDPARPVEALKACHQAGLSTARLLPYRAVGVECGLLLALRADSVRAGERELGGLLIALSPTPLGEGEYQALIGGI